MNAPFTDLSGIELGLLLSILVISLAAYRTTLLVIEDVITDPIRRWVWKRFPPEKSLIGYFFTCVQCVSVWASLVWLILFLIWPLQTLVVAVVMAISAIVVIIDTALKR